MIRKLSLAIICIAVFTPSHVVDAADSDHGPNRVLANHLAEWSFTASSHSYADPFNDVRVDLVVKTPEGNSLRIPAFWAGGQTWRARYASPVVGVHHWRVECSDKTNRDLNDISGTITIDPYTGDHPLYRHGFIRVSPDHRHLVYGDGKPFFWLGDTWWMGLCNRLHWPDDFQKLAADRKAKGFNVIQIVAGLYPDMFPFDPRGANEAGYPWEKDYARIRPEYFDAADKRIEYLVSQGFTPCIVGAWGYFMPWMGVEKMQQHWRYLIARYGAMPVVWCAAGEANLPWYLSKGFPYDDRKQVTQWTAVMKYIRETDPYHRLLTVHPTGIGRLSSRNATDDAGLLDFDMLQTPHGQRNAVDPTLKTVRASFADTPVIDGEAAYEMLGDSLPTRWTRQMFWLCMTSGAAGHTYGANGIWQVNRRGQPHGPSPHHKPGSTGYGVIAWDDAMNLPGSTQVGLGKKLFEKYDWQTFEPHENWAAYAPREGSKRPDYGPFATGSKQIRIIYVPELSPVSVNELEPTAKYRASIFNPASGRITDLGTLDLHHEDTASTVNAPEQTDATDWVVIVERAELGDVKH